MIRGVHAMLYTDRPAEVRAFLRDKLELPFVDAGDGWLIFDTPSCEIGCHPLMSEGDRKHHAISLMTDDVESAVTTLKERGVAFRGGTEDRGWGIVAEILLPDDTPILLYQPRYR